MLVVCVIAARALRGHFDFADLSWLNPMSGVRRVGPGRGGAGCDSFKMSADDFFGLRCWW